MAFLYAVLFTLPCLMVSATVCHMVNYRWQWEIQPWVMAAGGLALLTLIDQLGWTDWVILAMGGF